MFALFDDDYIYRTAMRSAHNEGKEEGLAKGTANGLAKGKAEGLSEAAEKMRLAGIPEEQIKQILFAS